MVATIESPIKHDVRNTCSALGKDIALLPAWPKWNIFRVRQSFVSLWPSARVSRLTSPTVATECNSCSSHSHLSLHFLRVHHSNTHFVHTFFITHNIFTINFAHSGMGFSSVIFSGEGCILYSVISDSILVSAVHTLQVMWRLVSSRC